MTHIHWWFACDNIYSQINLFSFVCLVAALLFYVYMCAFVELVCVCLISVLVNQCNAEKSLLT